jgi:Acetyl-CoA hydrolase
VTLAHQRSAAPREVSLAALDLAAYVRPGDLVLWGQSSAEPVALTTQLMAQRHEIGPFRCFLGISEAGTCRPEHGDVVTFLSYCAAATNRELARHGLLRILPIHYSDLPRFIRAGRLPVDVVMLAVPPPDPDGYYRLGVADEYLSAAVDRARVVIAEVNDQVPRVAGGRRLRPDEIDVVVPVSRPLVEVATRNPSDVEDAIARRVAELVPDGATLQVGIGSLPTAVLRALAGHRDLGVHSGLLSDPIAELMEAGVITNARKTLDRGITVGGVLMGTRRLFSFVDGNPRVRLRETGYTHSLEVIAAQPQFVAVNAALEVDLTGQVNTEFVGGSYVGAVGGAVDFVRGAHRSPGGIPITVLPATAGARSRIVARLSGPVSVSRADAGVVVTEYGVADLRGLSIEERQCRMLEIAHPDHRKELVEMESMASREAA